MGPDGTTLTLLHRAILLNDTPTACFLIRNGADVNSPSRPGKGGGEFSPPLHMACDIGLNEVVQCLVDHNADVNAKVQSVCIVCGAVAYICMCYRNIKSLVHHTVTKRYIFTAACPHILVAWE